MRYLYKQTGIEVESDEVLDSTMFKLITEDQAEVEKEPASLESEDAEDVVPESEDIEENLEIRENTEEQTEVKKETSAKGNTRKRTASAKK